MLKNNEVILKMVRDALDVYSHVGVRGLPDTDDNKKYRMNQYLSKSYYHGNYEEEYRLSGTSTIKVDEYDTDDEIIDKIKRVIKEYSYNDKAILVAGNEYKEGHDLGEIEIMNDTGGWTYRGGKFLGYLTE